MVNKIGDFALSERMKYFKVRQSRYCNKMNQIHCKYSSRTCFFFFFFFLVSYILLAGITKD